MSPAGRPKSNEAKRERFELRLSKVDSKALQDISDRKNITKNRILLEGLYLHGLYDDYPELEEIVNALLILHPCKNDKNLRRNALNKIIPNINALLKKLN